MITASELRQILDYNPETGVFRCKIQRGRALVSSVVGRRNIATGYVNIKISRQMYRAHRLAWLYTHGEWPALDIDHINGDGADNRISNLREATKSQNMANRRLQKHSCGFKGVSWHRLTAKWQSEIKVNGKRKHLGLFDDPLAAHKRYMEEANALHGEFARAA